MRIPSANISKEQEGFNLMSLTKNLSIDEIKADDQALVF
jgi:hypothetical protein